MKRRVSCVALGGKTTAIRNEGGALDSLRGSSVKIGTMQRIIAWPLRKDDTHKSRSVKTKAGGDYYYYYCYYYYYYFYCYYCYYHYYE